MLGLQAFKEVDTSKEKDHQKHLCYNYYTAYE